MADPLVLCYHAVSETWNHAMAVRPDALHLQMVRLLRQGFRPVTFSEAMRSPSRRALAVTFDDGFRSTWELAYPVLARLGVPATVFVPSAPLTEQRPLAWVGFDPGRLVTAEELLPMTWAHAAELAAAGWEVGAHSYTHPFLTRLDDAELRQELVLSRQESEFRLGRPCRTIAYPFGDLDARVQEAAREAGYLFGAALGPHPGRCGPLAVPRVGVYRGDGTRRLALKMSAVSRSRSGTRAVAAFKVAARAVSRGEGPRAGCP